MNIYFLAALEQRWLIIFCVFLGVCATVWFFLDMFSKDTNQAAESRLDMLNDRKRGEKNEKGKAAGVDKLTRALEKASPSLAKHLEPKTEAEKSRLVQRLSEAGFRSEAAPAMFLSIKVIVATVAVVIAGGATAFTSGLNQSILLRAVLGGGLAFFFQKVDGGRKMVSAWLGQKLDDFPIFPYHHRNAHESMFLGGFFHGPLHDFGDFLNALMGGFHGRWR